jgi:hypothetical protein
VAHRCTFIGASEVEAREPSPALKSSVELGIRGQFRQSCAFDQERQSSVRELVPVFLAAAVHDHQIVPSQVARIARSWPVAAALTVMAAPFLSPASVDA